MRSLTEAELAAAWRLADSNARLVPGDRMWSRFQVQIAMQKVILEQDADVAQEVCRLALLRRSVSEPLPGHDTAKPCVGPSWFLQWLNQPIGISVDEDALREQIGLPHTPTVIPPVIITRSYSVDEIDRMRFLTRQLHLKPLTGFLSEDRGRRAAETEDRLRTYMTNGTTIQELVQALRRAQP